MAQQRLLDLARPDAVAGRGDHIVGATAVPEVAVLVAHTEIPGQQPVAGELVPGGHRVVPVLEQHHRIGPPEGDLADLAGR